MHQLTQLATEVHRQRPADADRQRLRALHRATRRVERAERRMRRAERRVRQLCTQADSC